MKRILRAGALGLLVGVAIGGGAGCNIVGAIAYFLAPPRVQKAEYKLTDERVVVLVETKRPDEYNPVFVEALQTRMQEIFTEQNMKAKLVPQEDVLRVRQQHPDFDKWSLQKVAQRLNADAVLALSVDRLQVRASPEMPVVEPQVRLFMKLIGSDRPTNAPRLWPSPSEADGREVVVTRPPAEANHPRVVDEQAAKLGRDTAVRVAAPFYDVDLEKLQLREP